MKQTLHTLFGQVGQTSKVVTQTLSKAGIHTSFTNIKTRISCLLYNILVDLRNKRKYTLGLDIYDKVKSLSIVSIIEGCYVILVTILTRNCSGQE